VVFSFGTKNAIQFIGNLPAASSGWTKTKINLFVNQKIVFSPDWSEYPFVVIFQHKRYCVKQEGSRIIIKFNAPKNRYSIFLM
jgi:hypothetical protein